MKKLLGCFLCVMLLGFWVSNAGALSYDQQSYGGSFTVNGGIFYTPTVADQETVSSGSGVIDPFLTIQMKGYEEGFNTDYRPLPLDTKRPKYNHSIQVGDLIEGTGTYSGYYEFLLDINEAKSTPLITMHELEFYLADTGDISSYPLAGASLIWDLDAGVDNQVQLDYTLWKGSGNNIDLFVYIPQTLFGTDDNKYVYLFSAFGSTPNPSDAGYEEWVQREGGEGFPPPVPEPATILLLGSGLIGLAGLGRKKFKK